MVEASNIIHCQMSSLFPNHILISQHPEEFYKMTQTYPYDSQTIIRHAHQCICLTFPLLAKSQRKSMVIS